MLLVTCQSVHAPIGNGETERNHAEATINWTFSTVNPCLSVGVMPTRSSAGFSRCPAASLSGRLRCRCWRWVRTSGASPGLMLISNSGCRNDRRDAVIPPGPDDVAHLRERWATGSSSIVIPARNSGMTIVSLTLLLPSPLIPMRRPLEAAYPPWVPGLHVFLPAINLGAQGIYGVGGV